MIALLSAQPPPFRQAAASSTESRTIFDDAASEYTPVSSSSHQQLPLNFLLPFYPTTSYVLQAE